MLFPAVLLGLTVLAAPAAAGHRHGGTVVRTHTVVRAPAYPAYMVPAAPAAFAYAPSYAPAYPSYAPSYPSYAPSYPSYAPSGCSGARSFAPSAPSGCSGAYGYYMPYAASAPGSAYGYGDAQAFPPQLILPMIAAIDRLLERRGGGKADDSATSSALAAQVKKLEGDVKDLKASFGDVNAKDLREQIAKLSKDIQITEVELKRELSEIRKLVGTGGAKEIEQLRVEIKLLSTRVTEQGTEISTAIEDLRKRVSVLEKGKGTK